MRSKLFEFISRKNDEQSPKISAIIIDPKTGEPDYAKMVEFENMNTPRTFADRLFGRTLTKDYETNNTDEKGNADIQTHRASHTRGGLISDFIKGYEENYNDDFNINNLRGAKKSIANRIGEGLGTITRGLAGSLGDSYIAGVYGLPAAMQRQGIRTNDRLYREDLARNKVDTSNIRGFIDSNTYGNLIRSQQLRDNAEYRNEILKSNLAQQEALNQYRKNQLAYDWAALNQRGQKPRTMPAGSVENLSSTYQGLIQMRDLMDKLPKLPKRLTTPGVAQASAINPFDTDAQAFNQYVKTYKQVIGKGLEGGVLRKEDEYKYDQIIPKVGDTAKVLEQKAEQLKQMLLNKYNSDLEFLEMSGYDTSNLKTIELPKPADKQDSLGIL